LSFIRIRGCILGASVATLDSSKIVQAASKIFAILKKEIVLGFKLMRSKEIKAKEKGV